MNRANVLIAIVLFSILWMSGSCASNGNQSLQSITVTPSNADAQNFPGGQVQFQAMGMYSGGSSAQVPSVSLSWCASASPGVCVGDNVKPGVTINSTGVAECEAGSAGTWTINANSPPTSQASQPGGEIGPPIIFGSATLTCP